MDRYELFKDLLVMAISDGQLDENELRMLASRAVRWGITDAQFEDAIEYALRDDARLTIPPDHADRIELLEELLRMMAADGKLAEIEKRLFAVAAATMKISDEQLDALLDRMLR